MPTTAVGRPQAGEFAPFYERYVAQVPDEDVVAVLAAQGGAVQRMLRGVGEDLSRARYAEGKWSMREVLGHVIDAERVFAYRALSFARGEQAALPSLDQDAWVANSGHDAVPLAELLDEFASVRTATLHLMRHLSREAWRRVGTASGWTVSVRALAFIIAGHTAHHLQVLHERYGVPRPA